MQLCMCMSSNLQYILALIAGVMFAFESSVLNLASFVSPIFLNSVYSATVETQPNIVFIVMGVARIVPMILIA